MNFDKSIKFIVGHNGSGKSSILDALILGLGGRAINTLRYPHIKRTYLNFIYTKQNVWLLCSVEMCDVKSSIYTYIIDNKL